MPRIVISKEALDAIRGAAIYKFSESAIEITPDNFAIYVNGQVHEALLNKLSERNPSFSAVILNLIKPLPY